MPTDARMTIRLDPTARRKVERIAARERISLNEALNWLLQRAPEEGDRTAPRRSYRLKPRKVSFGFDIAHARGLAFEMPGEQAARKRKRRR